MKEVSGWQKSNEKQTNQRKAKKSSRVDPESSRKGRRATNMSIR
jgi:hypothetical protein